jgi:hypothetical protein
MSALYNNRSHDEDGQPAAELHDNAAQAQRSDAQARDKQEHGIGTEFSRRTLEHARRASEHTGLSQWCTANEHQIPVLGHHDIAVLAHSLWQTRGCPQGSPDVDWFLAACSLRDRA